MSGSAVPEPSAPSLTRRQIREAERAREAAKEAAAAAGQAAKEAAAATEQAVPKQSVTRQAMAEQAVAEEAVAPDAAAQRAAAPEQTRRAATRRAIRDAQAVRDAEAVRDPEPPRRGAEPAVPAPPSGEPATHPRRVRADATPTQVLTRHPAPGRREMRAQLPQHSSRRSRGWAPRAGVLGALGVLTIAAPLTGLASPQDSSAFASGVTVTAQTSVLDVLDSQAATMALAAVPTSLLAEPGAASRAAVLATSRASERDALQCAPVDGANGARAAVATEEESRVVMPIAAGAYRNTSPYGYRMSPFTGYSMHLGTDFAAPRGTPIHAVADGTVEYVGVGKDGRSSMLVIIKHELDGETFWSWHVHMYPDGLHVKQGQQVKAGDVIAEVGNNGNSTGPHLHFEIHTDDEGTTTEPLAWLKEHGAVDVDAVC
ncbi:M23 family metallopeptidase [Georgenia sp. SYP-B2076]|uniref:M23 family metallopeptidase n=1 Tax=Georgenia sp. SYP-B2076 TaxID=2495881 RepID=UPI000F8C9749|nr:M23 family metallopeptidase [Georgenia sp. SYP-B2076]